MLPARQPRLLRRCGWVSRPGGSLRVEGNQDEATLRVPFGENPRCQGNVKLVGAVSRMLRMWMIAARVNSRDALTVCEFMDTFDWPFCTFLKCCAPLLSLPRSRCFSAQTSRNGVHLVIGLGQFLTWILQPRSSRRQCQE